MVKSSDKTWHYKILHFKNQKNASVSECQAFLLDILQGLYEDISETIKVELLLVLQEHGEALIQTQELAEQAAGSIKSIIEDMQEKHDKCYIAHCLVTATSIILEFDLKDFNQQLVKDMVRTLMNFAKRVNQPGQSFVRKTACECLLELETSSPRILERYLNELYILSAKERTFAAQSYLVLFSTTLLNFLQGSKQESELIMDASSDISVSAIVKKKGKDMAAFISEDYNLLTSVAKWHVGKKLLPMFELLDMPVSILTTKLVSECSQAIELHTLHEGAFLAMNNQDSLRGYHDLKMVACSLLRSVSMPQLPSGFKCICLEWFMELLPSLQSIFMDPDSSSFTKDVFCSLTPTIFCELDVMQKKLEILTEIAVVYQDNDFNLMNLLKVSLKSADYGAVGSKLTTLYRAFYINFIKTPRQETRQEIADQIFKLTVKNPSFIEYTVDFIGAIREDLHEPICSNLICKIIDHILRLDFTEFMKQCDHYLIFVEHACCEKELWPMAIVKWLKKLCINTNICKNGNWQNGSNILLVCRSILRAHTSVLLLQELADFLWLLHQRYQNDDIKDRALFYYLTIGHASPQHYSKLFASTEAEHKMQAMSKRTEIEIPSDLMQGVLPTVRLDQEFLELTKTVQYQSERLQNGSDLIHKEIASYCNMLVNESFDRNIYLQLNIQHTKQVSDDIPTRVYALTLKFSSLGPYHDIPALRVPYLRKFTKSESSKGENVILKFEPKLPVPFAISVTAVFSNSLGRTCIAPLKPLQLKFEDFFNPLVCSEEQPIEAGKRKMMFKMLWSYFGENQRCTSSSDVLCAESVKRLVICEQSMKDILQNELQRFLVGGANGNTQVGIFLPPCYCILLKFEISPTETLVRYRLDNWELLGLVEDYLESLCLKDLASL